MQALELPVWLICLLSPQHHVTISYHQCEISDGSILTLDPGQLFSKAKQTLFKESSKAQEDIVKFRELRNRLSQTKPF